MGNDIIQARYDTLASVASRFGDQAQTNSDLLALVHQATRPLEAGGWQGRGSAAFFVEMNTQILPALQRLSSAFQEGDRVTLHIAKVLREAEEEAAKPFRSASASASGAQADSGAGGLGDTEANGHASDQTSSPGPAQSGPFRIGPPLRPQIQHDNGFLDQFAPREPTLADRASLLRWRAMLEGSEAFRPDLADANAAYRHFLDGEGRDRAFSYERYVESDASGQTTLGNLITDAQRHAEAMGQGRTQFSMTSDAYAAGGSDARFPYPQTENWQKTIGAHPLWTSAEVQVVGTPPDRTFTMTFTLHAEDRYNFNPGAADIATGIPDSDNGVFEITGLAHQYMNYGELTRVVTWTEGNSAHPQIVDVDPSRNRGPSDNHRVRNQL